MTTFTFRLEPLLRLRCAERDRRREELARAHLADQVLAQQQEAVERERAETRRLSSQESGPGPIHVDRLLHTHRYELLVEAQRQQLHRQREAIGTEIERRRAALVEADRAVRILEKLRERHQQTFEHDQQRADVRVLDEIALRRGPARREVPLR